jgi:hypothetical protein
MNIHHASRPLGLCAPSFPGRFVLALSILAFAGACAAPQGGGASLRPNSSVLSEEDIRTAAAGNLFDVVERLRPLWLRSGPSRSANLPTEVVVIVNDMYFGPVESLRSISSETVFQLRYLDSAAATAQLPGIEASRHVAGAIIVQIARR